MLLYLLNIQKTEIHKDKYVALGKSRSIHNNEIKYILEHSVTSSPLEINYTLVLKTKNAMQLDFHLFYAYRPREKLASCKSALNSPVFTLLTVLRRWSRCWSYSLLLCGLSYEAICFMSYLVLFCSCVFKSFQHCDYLAWGREG